MNINQKTTVKSFALAVCFLAVSTFAFSGCRSGGFKKPDLARLAFWKKADGIAANNTPPPPARHFDPSPINGAEISDGSDEQLVNLNSAGLRDRYGSSTDNKARSDINSALEGLGKKGLGKNGLKESPGLNTPIRKPYSSSVADASTNVRSKLEGFESNVDSKLSDAQRDFKAAMGGSIATKNEATSTNDFAPNGSLAPSNSFAARAAESANDMSKGWKDIETPTGFSSAANSINQSLAKATDAAYDANGRLANSASKVKDSFVAKANELANSTNSKLASPNGINSNGFSANSFGAAATNSNGFGSTDNSNSFASKASATSEFGQSTSTTPAAPALPSSPTYGSMAAAPASSNGSQDLMSQVADAKMQIEQLKQQVAQAQRLAMQKQNSFPQPKPFQPESQLQPTFQTQTQPTERVAQLQVPSFTSRTSQPPNGLASNGSSLPNNVLRGATDSLRTQQTPTPQQPVNNFGPTYPATQHDGFGSSNDFSSTAPPVTPAESQASFQSTTANQSASSSFYANGGTSHSAARIQNHVSEIDIPASVLNGVGSYAPGSVNPSNPK